MTWQTSRLGDEYVLAPDGSEIRPLVTVAGGSLVHCTLRPGEVTRPVQHRTVEEVWYCVAGEGELWRKSDAAEEIVALRPGVAISLPLGTRFQFRATRSAPLEVIITTLPPWPGEDEAFTPEGGGVWEPTR
jgi:mannose-6-phosphate isomerase-like protein (cupin superfamily)